MRAAPPAASARCAPRGLSPRSAWLPPPRARPAAHAPESPRSRGRTRAGATWLRANSHGGGGELAHCRARTRNDAPSRRAATVAPAHAPMAPRTRRAARCATARFHPERAAAPAAARACSSANARALARCTANAVARASACRLERRNCARACGAALPVMPRNAACTEGTRTHQPASKCLRLLPKFVKRHGNVQRVPPLQRRPQHRRPLLRTQLLQSQAQAYRAITVNRAVATDWNQINHGHTRVQLRESPNRHHRSVHGAAREHLLCLLAAVTCHARSVMPATPQ